MVRPIDHLLSEWFAMQEETYWIGISGMNDIPGAKDVKTAGASAFSGNGAAKPSPSGV
jgi:hypothetical protein